MKRLRKFFGNMTEDTHFYELLSSSATVFFVRVAAAGMAFLLSVYLARTLGTDEYGYFNLALTVVMISGILARIGLDNVVVKKIAAADEHNNSALVRGNYKSAVTIVMFSSLVLFLALYTSKSYLAVNFFHKPEFSEPLSVMLWFLVPYSVMFIVADSLRGIGGYAHSIAAQSMTTPTMTLVLVVILSQWLSLDLEDFILVYVVSSVFTLIYVWNVWHKRIGRGPSTRQSHMALIKNGLPLLLTSVGSIVLIWSDTVILGVYRSAEEVGLYTAGSRTAMLITMIVMAVNYASARKYSAFNARDNHEGLKKLSRQSTLLMWTVGIFPVIAFIGWPEYILLLFGDEYQVAAIPFVVLTIGYAASVFCGSVGILLLMTGHEKIVRNITFSVAILNIILSMVLVKNYGMLGVASATALSIILLNFWLLIMVRRHLGFWIIPLPARYSMS